MPKREPFDPGKPFDAMAERFRLETVEIAVRAGDAAIYREMDERQKLEALLVGIATGLMCIGATFTSDHERLVRATQTMLPEAMEHAKAMIDGGRDG